MAHNLETVNVNGFERVSYIENGKNEINKLFPDKII